MMKPPDSSPTPTPTPITFALTNCGQCGVDARPFLHHIRHRGLFRRLCTTCLLRANSQAFCPTCFQLHDPLATPRAVDSTTPCSKCYSVSHTLCIGPNPSKPYICPLCVAQFSPVFNWKSKGVIDKKSAAALLAAAKISLDSMSKAASLAKMEAEKRVKEANSTRKWAKEAIDNVACVSEKLENGENVGNEIMGFGSNVGRNVGERNLFGFDRVDNSSAVLAAFNAVELREKGKHEGGVNGNGLSNGNGREVVSVVDARPIAVVDQFVQNGHPREGNGGTFK